MELERRLEEDYRKKYNWRYRRSNKQKTTVYEYNHSPPKQYRNSSQEVRESRSQTLDSDTQGTPADTGPVQEDLSGVEPVMNPVYTSRGVGTEPREHDNNTAAEEATVTAAVRPTSRVAIKPTPGDAKIQVITRPRTFSGSSDGSFEDASSEAGSFLEETQSPTQSE